MNADNSMRKMQSIISKPDTDQSMYGSENIIIAGAMSANLPGKMCDEILYVSSAFTTEIASPVYLAAASSGKLIAPHNERYMNHRKLEKPSTCSPLLNAIPLPEIKLSTYRK
jgi:hypothetical protein